MVGSYLTTTFFLLFFLMILFIRSNVAFHEPAIRRCSLALIGSTMAYVLMDGVFIAWDLIPNTPARGFAAIAFLFYITYTMLPLAWHTFTRNFVGKTISDRLKRIEYIPGIALMISVLITPFTGALFSIAEDGSYVRGPFFTAYSVLNLFYYIEPITDAIVIRIRHKQSIEKYYRKAIWVSLIPLSATIINSFAIPIYQVYPFMPFCSVAVSSLAFLFMASVNSDTLQRETNEKVQSALEKAQEANLAKTKFLSNVSHDIRTPMNAIINLTDLARKENDINLIHDYLEKISLSGDFLLGLIDDILDMSRIESGKLEFHKEPLTRSEFLDTINTVVRPLMDERHINFHLETAPGTYKIYVDKLRYNQIFFNLLSNAAKFTPEGGDVWFEIKNLLYDDNKLKIQFTVRDNGIGMSKEFLEHIFEPFSREERSDLGYSIPGTGLGLAIVKRLVEAMDGTVSVKSKFGEGSEFVATIFADVIGEDNSDIPSGYKEDEHQDEKFAKLKGIRVLMVEDNELNVYVARTILEKIGCEVTLANNGQEALNIFVSSEQDSFDIILMDVRMPIMDGFTATQTIRNLARPDAKSIPIIAVTADAFDEDRISADKVGMTDYLSKPIDSQKLYRIIEKYVAVGKK